MSVPSWYEVELEQLAPHDAGWHRWDALTDSKVAESLRRHGQLRAIVIRRSPVDGRLDVVEGRHVLNAMRHLGWTKAWVVDVGEVGSLGGVQIALDLETQYRTNYPAVALGVCQLLEDGRTAEELAKASPFQADRIGHFKTLLEFDWNQYSQSPQGQTALDWTMEQPEEPPVPAVRLAPDVAAPVQSPQPPGPLDSRALGDLEVLQARSAAPATVPPQPAATDWQADLFSGL